MWVRRLRSITCCRVCGTRHTVCLTAKIPQLGRCALMRKEIQKWR